MAFHLDSKILAKIKGHGLVLYDGECGFCQFWVQFILKKDPQKYFLFAPLHAPWAESLQSKTKLVQFDSVLFWENGELFQKSDAALRIAGRLKFPWNLLKVFLLIPKFIRDFFYDVVARRRRQWSTSLVCHNPSPEERQRFLN